MSERPPQLDRWNLILGSFADEGLGEASDERYARMSRVLDYLYGREYEGRGTRAPDPAERGGSRDPSSLTVPEWIREVRDLFPEDVCEVVTKHALERYDLTELVTDPETLEKLEPNHDLLKAVLTFRGMMQGPVLETARRVVRKVVEDLRRRLESEVRAMLSGRVDRNRRTRHRQAKNLDLPRTIRESLRRYDPDARRLTGAELRFFSRVQRHARWEIIIAIDCSGSMIDSVIYSAVMAGIFSGLPSVRTRLVAFDTSVVDFSDQVDDPVEVLMSVQLGGGTDIAKAVHYCQGLVDNPTRTILVLVTDFEEGGDPRLLIARVKQLRGAGVRVFGLAALNESGRPSYDREIAAACTAAGADVAALTPRKLAEWVAKALQ